MTDEKRLAEALHKDILAVLNALRTSHDAEITAKDAEIERLRDWVARLNNREARGRVFDRLHADHGIMRPEDELSRLRAQPAADDANAGDAKGFETGTSPFVHPALLIGGESVVSDQRADATALPRPAADDVERAVAVAQSWFRRKPEEDRRVHPQLAAGELWMDFADALTAARHDARRQLADKPAPPDIISLVREFRRAVESTSVGDPLKMPEWRALCAAMNEIDAAGGGGGAARRPQPNPRPRRQAATTDGG